MSKFCMKSNFRFLALASLLALSSCGVDKNYNLYNNSNSVVDGNLLIRCQLAREYIPPAGSGKIDLSFVLFFQNKGEDPFSIELLNRKMYSESSNEEYVVQTGLLLSFTLKQDEEKGILFATGIPTYTSEDNYVFTINVNSKKLIYHFYDDPSIQTSSGVSSNLDIK